MSNSGTSRVFISDVLPKRHPDVVAGLRKLLGNRLLVIPGTRDIWCRDYMPVQVAADRFVRFQYDPDYLRDDAGLRTRDAARLVELPGTLVRSDIVLDGGNVVLQRGRTAVLTDKIYRENPRWKRRALNEELAKILEIEQLVVLPCEPGDVIGHADGMVRFVDDRTLLVNDYRKWNRSFGQLLENKLRQTGFELIPLPYRPTDRQGADPDVPSALGVYINFMQVGGLIVCPVFQLPADNRAMTVLAEAFSGSRIEPLDCRQLSAEGGVLNCVTWT